jgi:hypothetical protein
MFTYMPEDLLNYDSLATDPSTLFEGQKLFRELVKRYIGED